MSGVTTWWRQPDQFDWMTNFLRQRGLLRSARLLMAVVCLSSVLAPISVFTGTHRFAAGSLITGVTGAAFCVVLTCFWLTRWPTRRQSAILATTGVLAVASWSTAQPTAALAALACAALAIPGGYIAFFHSAKLLVFDFAIATAAATAAAWRLAGEMNRATAGATLWLLLLLSVAMPLAVWGIAHAMGQYATRSDNDALTGLLNRRGFIDAINGELASPQVGDTHLTVMLVDLDDFKLINDTQGHAAGDSALVAVAELLRLHVPSAIAICRSGGEEFVIAVMSRYPNIYSVATQLCSAISRLPHAVTASVGIASSELHRFSEPHRTRIIEQLISAADEAMYTAKRRGGDQMQHA
jgi:diguanylate cyclase (GGDEF)-like protein